MEIQRNVVGWFEIPVTDMDRAIKFYETVFGFKLSRNKMDALDMAWFPMAPGDAGGSMGSLVFNKEYYKPTADGVLIYFTAHSGDLSNELSRVEKAGGKIVIPRRLIAPDIGYMAVFIDTEGNRIALHSRK
jgi:predicted enzyme related to lactoylglutathione lyase